MCDELCAKDDELSAKDDDLSAKDDELSAKDNYEKIKQTCQGKEPRKKYMSTKPRLSRSSRRLCSMPTCRHN